jgi:hypothetical protein
MKLRTLVCSLLVLVPVLAMADPRTADEFYKEGETQYNLGNFDKAADAFKQGFSLETSDAKKPSYLYNVAQAYRQSHKCKDAAFFYKRYLSLKDQDTAKPLAADKRSEIEGWIAELEQCEKTEDTLAHKPPDSTIHPDGNPTTVKPTTTNPPTTAKPTTVAVKGDDDDSSSTTITKTTAPTAPQLFVARFTGGVGKISAGDLTIPIQATFSLFAGYPISINDQLEIDVGVDATYTPLPYDNLMTNAQSTASLITALADAGATYMVIPSLGIRADVGVGVLAFSGISDAGNPFTMNGAPATGTLGMLAVRGALAVDYAFTPNLIGTLTPIAYTYSPAKSGLSEDIKSITSIDFMLGLGYRM